MLQFDSAMKKLVILFAPMFVLMPVVSMASIASTTPQNAALLKNLPLFPGLEKKESAEDGQTKTLIGIFTKIQAEAKKNAPKLARGTHAKGSCFNGSLEVLSAGELAKAQVPQALIPRLLKGAFAKAGKSPALVRFANAKGDRNADTVGDVRGLSFAVQTKERALNGDTVQDFMMNSTPLFAVNNIHEFDELMKLARVTQGDFDYVINPFFLASDVRAKNLLDTYERADTVSYMTENYWGNLPYSHGVNADGTAQEVVKYKLTPCSRVFAHAPSAGKAADYLQRDISARAARGEVCFDLQVQLFSRDKMKAAGVNKDWSMTEWIENGGALWDEKILPFTTIARLTVDGNAASTDTKSDHQVSCEDVGFNTRLHSTRANQPLGSIARVRAFVEENSRARRMAK